MPFQIGQSSARRPRGIVKINDETIVGWMRFTVDANAFSAADTFSVTFAVSALPSDRDIAWFAEQKDMYIECFGGFPADPDDFDVSELQSLIYGQADEPEWDVENRLLTVHGRDLTRVFIDTKTTQKWPNQTASQIVTQLAQSHGLTPVVTASTEKVGRYYEIDHVELSDERSEWDLICYFAQILNYRAYVKGKSLYFEPKPDEATLTPYAVTFKMDDPTTPIVANVMRPMFTRSLTVSRGLQVVIRSWNSKQKAAFNASYPSGKTSAIKPGQSGSQTQVFRYTIAGLSQEAATKRAQAIYNQLVQHEMQFHFEAPADNDLDISNVIAVSGTGTAYDQRYFPDSISRTMSFEGGYEMTVHAKNHSPESDATA